MITELICVYVHVKGVGRNFSRGGLQGRAPQPFFNFQGAQPRFLVASMVKMKEFSGQGGGPWPPLAYACLRPWWNIKTSNYCAENETKIRDSEHWIIFSLLIYKSSYPTSFTNSIWLQFGVVVVEGRTAWLLKRPVWFPQPPDGAVLRLTKMKTQPHVSVLMFALPVKHGRHQEIFQGGA